MVSGTTALGRVVGWEVSPKASWEVKGTDVILATHSKRSAFEHNACSTLVDNLAFVAIDYYLLERQ